MNDPSLLLFTCCVVDQGKLCSSVPTQENIQSCVVMLVYSCGVHKHHRSQYLAMILKPKQPVSFR